MTITMVKKIKLDGTPCRTCADVIARLERAGLIDRIDRFVVADYRDPDSEGMKLGAELGIDKAPFFVIDDGGARTVYTSYVKLLKEVLGAQPTETDEAIEIAANTPNIDFL